MIAERIERALMEVVPVPTKATLPKWREKAREVDEPEPLPAEPSGEMLPSDDASPGIPGGPEPLGQEAPPEGAPLEAPPEGESVPEKTERVEFRLKPADKGEIEAAASKLGLTTSAYLIFLHKSYGGKVSMPQSLENRAPDVKSGGEDEKPERAIP